jgi:hypothetical protein
MSYPPPWLFAPSQSVYAVPVQFQLLRKFRMAWSTPESAKWKAREILCDRVAVRCSWRLRMTAVAPYDSKTVTRR